MATEPQVLRSGDWGFFNSYSIAVLVTEKPLSATTTSIRQVGSTFSGFVVNVTTRTVDLKNNIPNRFFWKKESASDQTAADSLFAQAKEIFNTWSQMQLQVYVVIAPSLKKKLQMNENKKQFFASN